jgi:hypothetical protein
MAATRGEKSRKRGVHRLVVEKVIGRRLKSDEIVIPIDGDKANVLPDNLFICFSKSEFKRRDVGSLPWPTMSNLEEVRNTETQ